MNLQDRAQGGNDTITCSAEYEGKEETYKATDDYTASHLLQTQEQ